MKFKDRQEISATVVFFFIPQLKEQEPNISYCALVSLHEILRNKLLDRELNVRILSSISGAIVISPDSSNIYIHQHLSRILEECKNKGIPIRLGITHGYLEILEDADSLFSFIGTSMNIAARLSTSIQNKAILYHSTYIDRVLALPTSETNDPLHPRFCTQIQIKGKPHDPIFNCLEPKTIDLVLERFNTPILSELSICSPDTIDGIAIAYDLPKYSQGDRSELSKRFRSVIDCIKSIRTRAVFPEEDDRFFFSPGGDGGILILPIKLEVSPREYINLAFELIETLEVESDSRDSNIDVQSRVGIHSGIIVLYRNAESILTPTGLTCFIADEIASDELAKQKGGIIITEAIKELLYKGNIKRIQKEYEPLKFLATGAAKNIQRYAKKTDTNSQTNLELKEQKLNKKTISNVDRNPLKSLSLKKSSQEIWRDWKEQANLKSGWMTFINTKSEANNSRRIANFQPIYEISKNELVYMEINLDYLQDRSLILLNSSIDEKDRVMGRYLICPSLDFVPLPNNSRKYMRFPQSEANKSRIKFNAKAREEFLAIVIDLLPNISWLKPNKQETFPELTDSRIYELWSYLKASNDNNWRIFYQSCEVK
jgi:hypothetical protein